MNSTPDDILSSYRRWLLKMANVMHKYGNEEDKQDLAQEGHIAMWKALKTYNPEKGSLASWLTLNARTRMSDVVRRGTYTGMPEHRGNKRVADTPVDITEDDLLQSLAHVDAIESIILAYHVGEISDALSRLTKPQRDYVIRRFWRCQSTSMLELVAGKRSSQMWKEIKPQLAKELGHLASAL